MKAFLPAIAKKFNIKKVYGICLAENLASVRVLEKCGFTQIYHGLGNYQGNEEQIIKAPLEKLQLKLQLLTPCFYKFAGR